MRAPPQRPGGWWARPGYGRAPRGKPCPPAGGSRPPVAGSPRSGRTRPRPRTHGWCRPAAGPGGGCPRRGGRPCRGDRSWRRGYDMPAVRHDCAMPAPCSPRMLPDMKIPLLARFAIVGAIAFALLLPIALIEGKIHERHLLADSVGSQFAAETSGPQMVAGPFLALTCEETFVEERQVMRAGKA